MPLRTITRKTIPTARMKVMKMTEVAQPYPNRIGYSGGSVAELLRT